MAGLDPAIHDLERAAEAAPKQLPMSLLAKQVEQLTEADLQSLVTSGVPESQLIDYKQTAVGNSDKDRYEFLADVSSFANSSGGEIIFGIAEANGLPSQICGLNVANGDQEILRLEQMARTGIRPPIHGIITRAIPLSSRQFCHLDAHTEKLVRAASGRPNRVISILWKRLERKIST